MSYKKDYTTVEVSERKYDSWSTAPNGSARCHDFYTLVTLRQTWSDDAPAPYAGRVYRIVERWISADPNTRGQFISSSSSPWKD